MDADDVRRLVAKRFPGVMESPLAQLFAGIAAQDEADRAIEFAKLQAIAERTQMLEDARQRALDCMDACGGWEVETLSHNIESNFPDLDADECDAIAERALNRS
jgi:hypothetical protein